MRKLILLVLIILTFGINTELNAQCSYDCTNPWIYKTSLADVNECTILISFKYRECGPPATREIEITNIAYLNDCSLEAHEAMQYAVKELLNISTYLFASLPDSSNEVHIYTECCWRIDEDGDINQVVPCDVSCCCKNTVTIEEYENYDGSKHFGVGSIIDTDTATVNCITGGVEPDSSCVKVCTYVNHLVIGENLVDPKNKFTCTDTCSVEWTTPAGSPIDFSGDGCDVKLNYWVRECGDKVQIKFASIEYLDEDCDLEDIIKDAIKQTIRKEFDNYSTQNFEINIPTCYQLLEYNEQHFAQVCYWEDNCCLASYKISYDGSNDSLLVNWNSFNLDTLNSFMSCGVRIECEFVCDSAYTFISYSDKFKEGAIPNLFDKESGTSIKINPNPSTEILSIEISTFLESDFVFKLYTYTGEQVTAFNISNSGGLGFHEIDISSYTKGSYMFILESNSQIINYGKIIIK